MTLSEKSEASQTVLVLGAYRGGTSMVSCALHHLGVPMGSDRLRDGCWEDASIRELLHLGDFQALERVIKSRNEQSVWGWKDPATISVIDEVLPLIRQPHLVVVMRDLAAIYQREARLQTRSDEPLLQYVAGQQARLTSLVSRAPAPLLLVSYERAVRTPELFVESLMEFLGLQPAATEVLAALQTIRLGQYYERQQFQA